MIYVYYTLDTKIWSCFSPRGVILAESNMHGKAFLSNFPQWGHPCWRWVIPLCFCLVWFTRPALLRPTKWLGAPPTTLCLLLVDWLSPLLQLIFLAVFFTFHLLIYIFSCCIDQPTPHAAILCLLPPVGMHLTFLQVTHYYVIPSPSERENTHTHTHTHTLPYNFNAWGYICCLQVISSAVVSHGRDNLLHVMDSILTLWILNEARNISQKSSVCQVGVLPTAPFVQCTTTPEEVRHGQRSTDYNRMQISFSPLYPVAFF